MFGVAQRCQTTPQRRNPHASQPEIRTRRNRFTSPFLAKIKPAVKKFVRLLEKLVPGAGDGHSRRRYAKRMAHVSLRSARDRDRDARVSQTAHLARDVERLFPTLHGSSPIIRLDVTRPDDFPAQICCGDPAAYRNLAPERGPRVCTGRYGFFRGFSCWWFRETVKNNRLP